MDLLHMQSVSNQSLRRFHFGQDAALEVAVYVDDSLGFRIEPKRLSQ